MRELSVAESRAIQIGILEELDRFCEDNNLTYYMSYGTLLGAVRHKGFIPWDDDIDVAMPYPDFLKFCEEYDGKDYRVNHWTKQSDFFCNYVKFEDTRTLLKEEIVGDYEIGINIDVAPIIGLPNDVKKGRRLFNKIAFCRKLLTLKKMKYRKERRIKNQIGLLASRLPLAFISNKRINMHIDSMCRKYPYEHSKYVICVGSFNPVSEMMEREKLGITCKLEFEGHLFLAPSGYNNWLKQIFGNYMELPPEEKRVSHHTFKSFWR